MHACGFGVSSGDPALLERGIMAHVGLTAAVYWKNRNYILTQPLTVFDCQKAISSLSSCCERHKVLGTQRPYASLTA